MSASELEQIRLGLLYKAKRNTIFAAACMLGYGVFLLYKLRDGGEMTDLLPLIGLFALVLIMVILFDQTPIKATMIQAAGFFYNLPISKRFTKSPHDFQIYLTRDYNFNLGCF